jgi:hypothetical protein
MKEDLEKLVKYCEKYGENKILEVMEDAYCDGAQGAYLIISTLQKLNRLDTIIKEQQIKE